jgi:hypothetical protein
MIIKIYDIVKKKLFFNLKNPIKDNIGASYNYPPEG